MTHPTDARLALYAGKDIGLWPRLRIARHLRRCEHCSQHAEEFRGIREWIRGQEDDLPAGTNWGDLAAEMRANIRLGLAAGQCVATPEEEQVRVRWFSPAMALPVLLVVIALWILQSLHPLGLTPAPYPRASTSPVEVLQTSSTEIGLEKDGRGFALLHPRGENVVSSVRGEAAVRVRYVDADTGQVTISHVYAQ